MTTFVDDLICLLCCHGYTYMQCLCPCSKRSMLHAVQSIVTPNCVRRDVSLCNTCILTKN